jgi:hypothetical protein
MKKKAEYQMTSSLNDGILEIIITGKVTSDDTEKIMKKIIAVRKSINTKCELIDVRTLKGRLGISETYDFIRKIPSDSLAMNIAFVDIVECAEYNLFYQATVLNLGLSWKWFTDIDAARAWLKSKLRSVNTDNL